jgi:crotonobetainyl-CoA:carnitine CoA-transferase CaiB-like acyl-CoA transferase
VDIHDDPQLVSRGFWVWLPHEKMHPYRQTGQTWRLADAPVHEIRRAPFFGEHNDEILREAGLDTDALEVLEAAAVIATAPINPGVG